VGEFGGEGAVGGGRVREVASIWRSLLVDPSWASRAWSGRGRLDRLHRHTESDGEVVGPLSDPDELVGEGVGDGHRGGAEKAVVGSSLACLVPKPGGWVPSFGVGAPRGPNDETHAVQPRT
jgi:hypothetical protein